MYFDCIIFCHFESQLRAFISVFRSILSTLTEETKENAAPAAQFGKPGSAQQRTLDKMVTNFYVGTEDGELVYVDWIPQKDQDTGKVQTMKPEFYNALHDGPIVALQRCPFDRKVKTLLPRQIPLYSQNTSRLLKTLQVVES